ncbi:copper amine oxidase N-terminal domain-containing protein [Saccharibacillus sacchari]|uniref:copper amine oxidase N-terminal domain-containing protein n=1 Tax=Saccharibacillus sacchari TaxID=456493 RepID=UPI000569929F|nr:copper amine oxidase N-terminal domain-containing protein [Saccharibacillus sacchari]
MRTKKIFSFLMVAGTAIGLSVQASAATNHVDSEPPVGLVEPPYVVDNPYSHSTIGNLNWNGKALSTTPKPVIVNGSLMVPAKDLFEQLGMEFTFDKNRLALTASKSGLELKYSLKSFTSEVNGKKTLPMRHVPFIETKSNRVFVSLRNAVEAAGATVKWDNANKVAKVTE